MSAKRHEGSLYGSKKKKRVRGCVDRVTGGIVRGCHQTPG